MSKKEKLDILYEDKNIIVVNKPSGLLCISSKKVKENTLYYKVSNYVKKKNKNNKIFIVHRLDKDTSGIVVFSKSQSLKSTLQNGWEKYAKERRYVAIVEGVPQKNHSTLKSLLKETSTFKVYSSSTGKLAITKYRVISSNNNLSLLDIEIKTGRKNQIRVQLSDIGNPIIGDKKYNSKVNPIGRLGLHANKLVLINPITNKRMVFECDLPNGFVKLFN
ncbi:MAG: RNA pseudouridine synthase [bacterium]|nr:RNA pseudouridine synthase [bacterium]